MKQASAFISISDKDGLDRLAVLEGKNRSQKLRDLIGDFLINPDVQVAENVEPPSDQFGSIAATQVEDEQYATLAAVAESRRLKVGTLLRSVIHRHVEDSKVSTAPPIQLRPPIKFLEVELPDSASTRKPYVTIDPDPKPWLRMSFWSKLTTDDIMQITGCSTTTANRYARNLVETGIAGLNGKRVVLLDDSEFKESANQFLENLLRATICEEDALRACGANPPVSIKMKDAGIEASVLKTLLSAIPDPNQHVDLLVTGGEELVRCHPLGLVFDEGTWKLRINEFLPNGGLLGEKSIPLDMIAEAELFVPTPVEPETPKRRGRQPSQKRLPIEPETYDKNNRVLVPAGTFEVGATVAGKVITKLGRACFDPEFDQLMQYAYY